MKKMFFLAATAALALSSCSSDELVQAPEVNGAEDGAVVFSAYTGRATRAMDITTNTLKGVGFGVFAFEQGTTPWATYSTYNTVPNFMYNQEVKCDVTQWNAKTSISLSEYDFIDNSALKALYTTTTGNFTSSQGDVTTEQQTQITTAGLTLTTYATDDSGYKWNATISTADYLALYAQLPELAASIFTAGTGDDVPAYTTSGNLAPSAYAALTTNADRALLTPVTTAEGYKYSPVKYFSNNEGAKHSFFAYAPYDKDVKAVFSLANGAPAVRYNAADDYDLVWAKQTDVEKLKASTDEKVTFAFAHALAKVNFEVSYFDDKVHDASHNTADDKLDANTTITVRSVKFVGPVPSQGVLNLGNGNWTYEATEEGAYEFAPTTAVYFTGGVDAANVYKPLKQEALVLPTIEGNNLQIQVVYDVTTVDPANPRNNSTVTNTITSTTTGGYKLSAGKIHTFKLDLGLTSVKFDATVGTWTDADPASSTVDLPNNK